MGNSVAEAPVAEFLTEMQKWGLPSPEVVVADGSIHRFKSDGDHGTKKSGWYVLHAGTQYGFATHGAFGDWRGDLKRNWSAYSGSGLRHNPIKLELERYKAGLARTEIQMDAARRARKSWAEASAANASHPYLINKALPPLSLRQNGNSLLIPIVDLDGAIHSIQRIEPDGSKRFASGGRVSGLFALLGTIDQVDRLCICEGWATAATIYLSSGLPTFAALSAKNLIAVAIAARGRWPEAEIVVAVTCPHE